MPKQSYKLIPAYYLIVILAFALAAFGLVMTFSASSASAFINQNDSLYFFKRQLVYVAVGTVGSWLISRLDYRKLKKAAPLFLLACFVLLILPFIPGLGYRSGGATRWINLGFFQPQPSEIVKLFLVIYFAAVLASKRYNFKDIRGSFVKLLLPLALVFILIIKQPDMGTAVIVTGTAVVLYFLAGAPLLHFLVLLPIGSLLMAVFVLVAKYRLARWLAFLNPWADPSGKGYQIVQSLISFGSGGLTGVGLGASRQKFGFLPAAHTDFIFAIIGEEAGLIGTLSLVIIYLIFAVLFYRAIIKCRDKFGQLLAAGISVLIVGQAVINMAAATSLIPVTGVPLPLVSFGGSSIIMNLLGLGLLLSIIKFNNVNNESFNKRRRHSRPHLSRFSAG